MALGFGLVGFIDDYIKVVKKRNLGLNVKQKLILQFLVAGAYLFSLWLSGVGTSTLIPFIGSVDVYKRQGPRDCPLQVPGGFGGAFLCHKGP